MVLVLLLVVELMVTHIVALVWFLTTWLLCLLYRTLLLMLLLVLVRHLRRLLHYGPFFNKSCLWLFRCKGLLLRGLLEHSFLLRLLIFGSFF